jgi:hypothetical protein
VTLVLLAAALPWLYWDQGGESAERLKSAGIARVAVPRANEAAWKALSGFEVRTADPSAAEKLAVPGVQYRANQASATRSPWIDTNGWQFARRPKGTFYYDAPGMAAGVAAAEAFLYRADALVHTDTAGLGPLGQMLGFLRGLRVEELPAVADIGFIDDGSAEAGEAMNLMGRKNLLYRVVERPDPKLKVNIRFGSGKYTKAEAQDPVEVAQRIRYELTDERRSLRIFGSEVALARLFSDGRRARVEVVNYAAASRALNGIRVRVLGRYAKHSVEAAGSAGVALADYTVTRDATEFTLPELKSFAAVALEP